MSDEIERVSVVNALHSERQESNRVRGGDLNAQFECQWMVDFLYPFSVGTQDRENRTFPLTVPGRGIQ